MMGEMFGRRYKVRSLAGRLSKAGKEFPAGSEEKHRSGALRRTEGRESADR